MESPSDISRYHRTDTRIIVDDMVSHGPTVDISLLYMECQLRVCRLYHLSLSLKKSDSNLLAMMSPQTVTGQLR